MAHTKYDAELLISKATEILTKFNEIFKNDLGVDDRLAKTFTPYRQRLSEIWNSGHSKRQLADAVSEVCGFPFSESQLRTLFKKIGVIGRSCTGKKGRSASKRSAVKQTAPRQARTAYPVSRRLQEQLKFA